MKKFWNNLTKSGKVIAGVVLFIIVITCTIPVTAPVGRLIWYLSTTEVPQKKPHINITKHCPPLETGFRFENDSFIVDKKVWFCIDSTIPQHTKITYGKTVILPTTETHGQVTFSIEIATLPDDWRLVAKN